MLQQRRKGLADETTEKRDTSFYTAYQKHRLTVGESDSRLQHAAAINSTVVPAIRCRNSMHICLP